MTIEPTFPKSLAARPGRLRDVICVGTALVDHLVFADDEVVAGFGFEKGSMNLVDVATGEAIRSLVGDGRVRSGGAEANTAVGVVSLGGSAMFVGAVGADEHGDGYVADIESAGVEARLERLPVGGGEASTGRCVVLVTPDAERTMATALGVAPFLDHAAVDAAAVASAQIAYFDGYVLDFPDSAAIVAHLVADAGAGGTLLAFGLADVHVVDRHRMAIERLVGGPVGLLFANESEATALTGASDAAGAALALGRSGLVVVVTRGARGAVVVSGTDLVEIPAEPVEEVVDATGAGDLFAAGFCYGASRGYDLSRAARLGALAASEVIGHLGGRPERSLAGLAATRGLLGA